MARELHLQVWDAAVDAVAARGRVTAAELDAAVDVHEEGILSTVDVLVAGEWLRTAADGSWVAGPDFHSLVDRPASPVDPFRR